MSHVATIIDPAINVLAEAAKYLKVREQPKSSNRGTEIDYWLKECGVPKGLPWCAVFTWNVGRQVMGHAWPVPRSALVQDVYRWGERNGLLRNVPEIGDIFVLYYPSLNRHGHIGFVTKVRGTKVGTVEGNTNDGGSRDGYGVFERRRPINSRMKFIRWVEALPECDG